MGWAALEEAAGGQAALAAARMPGQADLDTLAWVAAALREQLGGELPVMPEGGAASGRAGVLERRLFTPAWHLPPGRLGGGRRSGW